jgi:hypothetical protein
MKFVGFEGQTGKTFVRSEPYRFWPTAVIGSLEMSRSSSAGHEVRRRLDNLSEDFPAAGAGYAARPPRRF